jgi:hypothetical protein
MEKVATFDIISMIASIICAIAFIIFQIIQFKNKEIEGFVFVMSIFASPVVGVLIYTVSFFAIPFLIFYGIGKFLETFIRN